MELGPIKAWSFSRLDIFEKCPWWAKLEFADKLTGEKDVKSKEAMDRGTKVHTAAEDYVRGELDSLPKELKKFELKFAELRELREVAPGLVVLEEEWAFDTEWASTGWWDDNAWCRMKADRLVWQDEEKTAAEVVDYKTGKKEGNEVKHGQQVQLMTLGAFLRYPSLQVVVGYAEYLDHGKRSLPKRYTREQAMAFLPGWDRRGKAMTTATTFPPKPNRINCAYCPFGPNRGDGSCEYGVEV